MNKWLYFGCILLAVGVLLSGANKNYNEIKPTQHISEEIVLSEDEYKAQCSAISYNDIARNPNNYVGQKTNFKGNVIQVQENGKNVVLRINTKQDQYGWWEDTIYVDYTRKDDNESRVLEDDIVTVYGEIKGIKNYIAVFGNQISIPHIKAEYIDIH